MKLWIDDIRPAPEGYVWCKSVNQAKEAIILRERITGISWPFESGDEVISAFELIDIDHDAGDYASDGDDYIKLLNWLEETGRNYPIHIHSANPVGIANMRRIIKRNGWKEIV